MAVSTSSSASTAAFAPLFDQQTISALAFVASMVATALALAKVALPQNTATAKPSKKGAPKRPAAQAEQTILAGSKVKMIFTWLVFDAICHLTRM